MTYICLDCGNTESFEAYQDVTEWKTENITIDGEGTITDWGDSDTNDSDVTDGPKDIECSECDSDNVEDVDEEDIERIKEKIRVRLGESTPTRPDWQKELGE